MDGDGKQKLFQIKNILITCNRRQSDNSGVTLFPLKYFLTLATNIFVPHIVLQASTGSTDV